MASPGKPAPAIGSGTPPGGPLGGGGGPTCATASTARSVIVTAPSARAERRRVIGGLHSQVISFCSVPHPLYSPPAARSSMDIEQQGCPVTKMIHYQSILPQLLFPRVCCG